MGSRGDGWTGGRVAVEGRLLPLSRGLCLGEGRDLEHRGQVIGSDTSHLTKPNALLSQWGNFPSRPRSTRKRPFCVSSLRAVVWKAERREDEREAVELVHLVLDL